MYSKCGYLSYARHLFEKTQDRDIVTWNSILGSYALSAENGDINSLEEGLHLFKVLRKSETLISKLTVAPVLKLCLQSGYIWASQSVHGYSIKICLECDVFVSGSLVNIYSKLGRLIDAQTLFEEMQERDVVLWNVMLKAYVLLGIDKEIYNFFSEFHRSGLRPDDASIRCVLSGIPKYDSCEGKVFKEQVQAYATKICFYNNSSDVILWNKTLSDYIQSGDNLAAIGCFVDMNKSNVEYDDVTLAVALAAIGSTKNVYLGQQMHGLAVKSGYDSVISVANSLINMYSKTGCLYSAQKLFSTMKELDLVSWNSMISSCAQSGFEEDSVILFIDMIHDGLRPDHFTLASVLRACSSLAEKGLNLSKQIHAHAVKTGLITDRFISTSLIDAYSKNGSIEDAEFVFRNSHNFDLGSFNSLMYGYIISSKGHQALNLFTQMHKRGEKSDEITFATVAKACATVVRLKEGRQIHSLIIKLGFDSDLFVTSGILDMYIKCGDTLNAERIFNGIPEPDDVAWTAMISGSSENGYEECALLIYHRMRLSGVQPDEFTYATLIKAASCLTALEQGRQIHANVVKLDFSSDTFVGTSLIDMYAKCGYIEDSYLLFKRMDARRIASWNAMIVGLAQHGNGEEALKLFQTMNIHGIKPDRVTFIGVLSACSHSGFASEAHKYFDLMYRTYGIEPEIEHYSCLVDALGRAGLVKEAENVINSMPYEASPSMCRALLGACRVRGNTETGEKVAERLLAMEPFDSSTYVLLSNMYAATNRWEEAIVTRKKMKRKNMKKDPGFSWIDVKNKVHLFVVDDKSHPEADMIYNQVEDMIILIKEEGYVPDTDFVLHEVEEEEKERALYYHSEKLAIAYGLISTPSSSMIRIIKNLRICGDCHNAIKYVSLVYGREIVLRDANRFHQFKGGVCSCGDYW